MKNKKILWIICIGLTSSIFTNYLFLSSSVIAHSIFQRFEREYIRQYRENENLQNENSISTSIVNFEELDRGLAIYNCQQIIDQNSDWKEIENRLYRLYSIIYQRLNRESDSRPIIFSFQAYHKVRTIDYLIQKSNSIEEKDCSKILEIPYPTITEILEFTEEILNLSKINKK